MQFTGVSRHLLIVYIMNGGLFDFLVYLKKYTKSNVKLT